MVNCLTISGITVKPINDEKPNATSITGSSNNRFIPARAGNTHTRKTLSTGRPVYPRRRGEHCPGRVTGDSDPGLSPLARGTLCCRQTRRPPARFIPAGAGNTRRTKQLLLVYSVYPRWRGEHLAAGFIIKCLIGLSPLARGTLKKTPGINLRGRFIPAGAGNTVIRRKRRAWFTVYPRWRGEHNMLKK